MKIAQEFQAHVELPGHFEVFVIPVPGGTKLQFYPPSNMEGDFTAYLTKRFAHLGEPAECVLQEEIRCYEVFFRGLRWPNPEEALRAIVLR